MKIKKIILIVIIIPFLSLTASGKSLNELDELKEQYNQLKDSEETKRAMLEVNYNKQDEIKKQISDIDAQLSESQVNLDKIDGDMMNVLIKINNAQEDYDTAAKKRQEQYAIASKRIRYIYENGKNNYFTVLINSGNLKNFLVLRQYISDIMKYDSDLLNELEKTEKYMKEKLDEIKEGQEAKKALENFREATEIKMTVMHEEKSGLLNQYRQDAQAIEAELAELKAASDKVHAMITDMEQNMDFVNEYTGGKLEWPVEGRYYVSSDYSIRESPVGNGSEFHTGIDIPAPQGYDIKAAEEGYVTLSEWITGYGNTVIVYHGGGLYTLYGHNSELIAKEGDRVKGGQVIAKCGSTGYSTGSHCHFEVRLNGEHVNPWDYLEEKTK